jgi:hypothetical protein
MRARRAMPTTKDRLPGETETEWLARLDRLAVQQHQFKRSYSDNLRRLQENEKDRITVPKP